MPNFVVYVKANNPPVVAVTIEDCDTEPTEEQIDAAVETLAQDMSLDGYLAEYMTDDGWTVDTMEAQP